MFQPPNHLMFSAENEQREYKSPLYTTLQIVCNSYFYTQMLYLDLDGT